MIDVSPSVEIDCVLEMELGDYIAFVGCSSLGSERCVEIIDVGLMMFGMMESHNLGADDRFQALDMLDTGGEAVGK
jgi:hypothetical protein